MWIWIATWIKRMKGVLVWAAVMALACAAAGVLAYRTGHANGAAAVTAEWSRERAATARATVQALERRIETETALRAAIDRQRQEHAREKDRIAAAHRRIVDSLRERPARADHPDVPGDPAAGPAAAWCTGARLHREDGEFLAGEAARAAELQAELRACHATQRCAGSFVPGAASMSASADTEE